MTENGKPVQNSLAIMLDQIRRSREAYQEYLAPAIRFQKTMKEPIQSILDAHEKMVKSIKPTIDIQQRILDIYKSVAKEISSTALQALKFQKTLISFISPSFEKFYESLKKAPAQTRKAVAALGKHGWFLDMEMPMPGLWQLEEALNSGNIKEAENALVEYYRKRTLQIEESLCGRFSDRAKILHSAFKAHSRGEYELSVPVFLAQADGICQEAIGIQFFQKRNKIPATAIYVQKLANDTISSAFLHPLSLTLPISASKKERDDNFNELNRHQVLHGESTSYGSEVNSLKAISLINYLAQVLMEPEDNHKKP